MTRRALFTKLAGVLSVLPFVGKLEAQVPRFYRPRHRSFVPAPIWTWRDGAWIERYPPSGVHAFYRHGSRLAWGTNNWSTYHPTFRRGRLLYPLGDCWGACVISRDVTPYRRDCGSHERLIDGLAWVMADPLN